MPESWGPPGCAGLRPLSLPWVSSAPWNPDLPPPQELSLTHIHTHMCFVRICGLTGHGAGIGRWGIHTSEAHGHTWPLHSLCHLIPQSSYVELASLSQFYRNKQVQAQQLSWSCTASKWQSRDLNPNLFDNNIHLLNFSPLFWICFFFYLSSVFWTFFLAWKLFYKCPIIC